MKKLFTTEELIEEICSYYSMQSASNKLDSLICMSAYRKGLEHGLYDSFDFVYKITLENPIEMLSYMDGLIESCFLLWVNMPTNSHYRLRDEISYRLDTNLSAANAVYTIHKELLESRESACNMGSSQESFDQYHKTFLSSSDIFNTPYLRKDEITDYIYNSIRKFIEFCAFVDVIGIVCSVLRKNYDFEQTVLN